MQCDEAQAFVDEQPTAWHRLAAALVVQALKDAASGDSEAVAWMQSRGVAWLESLGLDAGALLGQLLDSGT